MGAAKKIEVKKIDFSKLDMNNLKIHEAAAYLGIALGTFYNMRYRNEGPKYRKGPGGIKYKKADLDQWQKDHMNDPES